MIPTEQLFRFASVGALNTAVGLGTIWLFMLIGASPIMSNALGYAIGLVVSFSLNKKWTFKDNTTLAGTIKRFKRFFLAFFVSWLVNIAVIWIGVHKTALSPYLVQVAGMISYTAIFFYLCRSWVFR